MTAPPLAFELDDVSLRYGRRWALSRLSCSLRFGSSLLLTGHNGSGKTTLLRLLATAHRATAGKLRILGIDPATDRDVVRRQVALLTHQSYLYEDLGARENLLLWARLLGLSDPRARCDALLDKVGLSGRGGSAVRQLSAGMRKRLAVARLLMKTPRLALLDEPFGQLDPGGISQMQGWIEELKAAGASVVLATHLLDRGAGLCDERLHLDGGRKVAA